MLLKHFPQKIKCLAPEKITTYVVGLTGDTSCVSRLVEIQLFPKCFLLWENQVRSRLQSFCSTDSCCV